MARVARVRRMTTVSPPIVERGQMGYQLVRYLALRLHHLLQANDLVDEYLVRLRKLEELLLQGLDLMLRRGQRLAEHGNLLARGERLLDCLRLSWGWCFPPNVVQVVFPIRAKLRMTEFPRLDTRCQPRGTSRGPLCESSQGERNPGVYVRLAHTGLLRFLHYVLLCENHTCLTVAQS